MSVRSFFDSNILIYTDDAKASRKREICLSLLEEHQLARTGIISIQVLQEYFVIATQKLRVAAEMARYKLTLFGQMETVRPELADILAAVDLSRLHKISFWDALILQAAQATHCKVLYSEDLQPGRNFSGLRVVNPFY